MAHISSCLAVLALFTRTLAAAPDGTPATAPDKRLDAKVTLAVKATALSDLCARLRTDTGIALAAGASVADEKVTLFCKQMPVRDVMRQLARPFGYAWLRSGGPPSPPMLGGERVSQAPVLGGERVGYRYELVQDLRSQLVEEELRSRARSAALLALDREMSRFRPYLSLSPDEARARAATAPPEEKKTLEQLAGSGWGPIHLYFRLSPDELAALRAGQVLTFGAGSGAGRQPLPPEFARGALQSLRQWRVSPAGDGFRVGSAETLPAGRAPASIPEASALVTLRLAQDDLGQVRLAGATGFLVGTPGALLASWQEALNTYSLGSTFSVSGDDGPGGGAISSNSIAVGTSPAVDPARNAAANARLARDTALQPRVTVRPHASCGNPTPSPSPTGRGGPDKLPSPRGGGAGSGVPKATTADVLEALHRATGRPIVADYYTRLYPPAEVSVQNQTLFDALNRLADATRLRWNKDGEWLQFRSVTFYDDRMKEVPNGLLSRWSAARRQRGGLTLEEVLEIAQLTDAQLDGREMAEGAKLCFGLAEWDTARARNLRPHLRYLVALPPALLQQAQSAAGLPFTQMPLAQQQQFLGLALGAHADRLNLTLQDLTAATMRVEYTAPNLQIIYTLGASPERRIRRTVTPTGGGLRGPS